MMAKNIYPGGVREKYFANMYCEMAMEAYYNATISHNKIKEAEYSWDYSFEYDAMNKSIINTIIFSAMAIEAFVNDYAAACLGDSDFYDNFDRLSAVEKFELIARFILKEEKPDRGKSYYSHLKALFKERNSYVHSKSKRVSLQGYTSEELQKLIAETPFDITEEELPTLDAKEMKGNMRKALDALKAIYELAIYFDERDSNVHAVVKLLGPFDFPYEDEKKQQYKKVVFHLLGIKVDE